MAILKDLIVHGSSRFLNKIYASEIQTPLIEAEAGIIKKLKADDATVVGLLDVKGQLHTNSWSNSNIATIDGSFYITPTIGSASGTVTITTSSLVFSGTNYAVSSLYLGDGSSITWPQYSKVLVTGQILSNGEWIPLGTLLGQLSSTATAASISINNIKDNKNQTSNVLTTLVNEGTTSSSYRNLKVSLYQRASGSTTFYPLGIYMTATGTNGRTFLDIYGGVEALSNSNNYGGFAEPNVRIGNLQGLPNVGGQTPSGWGIYTDNGYFKGIIAADQGYIGSGSKYWVIANEEDLSNAENSRSFIYNGTNSTSSNIQGIYLGTDGIRNYEDSTHFVTIKDGVITAQGVNLSGTINASSGYIAGWRIASTYLSSTTATAPGANILILSPKGTVSSYTIASQAKTGWMITAGTSFGVNKDGGVYASKGKIGGWAVDGNSLTMGTWGTDNSAMICTGSSSAKSIGGSEATVNGWIFTAGANFGVTKTGALYANSANISGKIVATEGSIGGINIINGNLDVSSISIGNLSGANDYAQKSYVDDTVDNIEIGGRNLAKEPVFTNPTVMNGLTLTRSKQEITITGTNTKTDAAWSLSYFCPYSNLYFKRGETYTLSVYGNLPSSVYIQMNSKNTSNSQYGMVTLVGNGGNKSVTFTIPSTHDEEKPVANAFIGIYKTATTIDCTFKVKLEKGNKATDWTPAPEDVDEAIDNAEETATSYITYINSTDGIKIHNVSDQSNYLKLNSSAISMYRNNIETLNISNNEIRIGKVNSNNVYINNTSVNIREGQNTLAFFGVDGMQIGLNNETRIEQDYHSWKMIDKDNNIYAFVSDLRDENGEATITEIVKLNEATNWAETNFEIGSIINITVNGNAPDSYEKMLYNLIDIEPEPTDEDVVIVTYTSQSPKLKAYTFGERYPNSNIGGYSFAEGNNCTSSGYSSHAEGVACTSSRSGSHAEGVNCTSSGQGSHAEGILTTASGRASHAQNFVTTASSMYQTTIGKYNIDDTNNKYAFIIGNGGFDQEHSEWRLSNAFTVDWDGNVEFSGNMYCAGGNYLPSNINIDNLTKKHSGWWVYARSNTSGTFPITDTYGTIGHIQGTSDNVAMQFLRSNTQGVTSPILYTRYKIGGTWGAWQRYVSAITSNLTITRTNNSYCNATDIGYLQAYKKGGYLSLRGNLHLTTSMPTGTENVQIATISNWQGVSGLLCIPAQTGNSTLTVSISSSGVVTISNYSGVATSANWFRFTFTTPCEDGYE